MAQKDRKRNKIRDFLTRFETEAQELGLKYFIGAINRSDLAVREEGDGYLRNDMSGEDFIAILNMAFRDDASLMNLAAYVHSLLQARNLAVAKTKEENDTKEQTGPRRSPRTKK